MKIKIHRNISAEEVKSILWSMDIKVFQIRMPDKLIEHIAENVAKILNMNDGVITTYSEEE